MGRKFAAFVIGFLFCGLPCARAQAGLSRDEQELLALLNQERANAGLSKFSFSEQLSHAAQSHTELLVEHGQLSHQFQGEPGLADRVGATGLRYEASGENVALASNIEEAHQGLMHSLPHRANILNPQYNEVGISVMVRHGTLFVTEDFAHTLPTFTEDQFRDGFVAAFNKARTTNGRAAINAQPDSRLREAACSEGTKVNEMVNRMYGASDWIVFTSVQPEPLPAEVLKAAADSTFRRMNLGVCYLPRKESGYAMFRVVAVFYLVK